MKRRETNVAKVSKGKKAGKTARKVKSKKTAKKTIAKQTAKKVPKKKPVKSKPIQPTAPKISAMNWQDFITPLDDRLIVQMDSAEKRTAGGLIIPDTADLRGQFRGTVIVVGRGHRDEKGHLRPMDVKAGDTVVFDEYSGSKINLNGTDVRIMRESEVLAVVEK
jgi:chaperonin GroES